MGKRLMKNDGGITLPVLNSVLHHTLEDDVYDLIRDEVSEPMTMSKIRHRIEKKYETYLSVFEEDGVLGYYFVYQARNRKAAARKSEKFYATFNEAMRALIVEMGKDLKR